MHRLPLPKNAWLDIALLAAILLALPLLFPSANLGWHNGAPTPYLLLPVWAGARYGWGAGLAGGTVAFALSGLSVPGGLPHGGPVETHYGLLFWSLGIGAFCGGIHTQSRQQRRLLADRDRDLQQRLSHLDAERLVFRQTREELDRLQALQEREQSSLDAGLRWLSAAPFQRLALNTLLLLNLQTRVTDAALYYLEPAGLGGGPGPLSRAAILGRDDHLPEKLNPNEVEMARAALERSEIVAVPELPELALLPPQFHLAAVPLLTRQGEPFGLLLVSGMPLTAFTPHSISRLALICKWAAEFMELKDPSLGEGREVLSVAG